MSFDCDSHRKSFLARMVPHIRRPGSYSSSGHKCHSAEDSCCDESNSGSGEQEKMSGDFSQELDDLEQGPPTIEHVTLGVGGMACSCCPLQLVTAFRGMPVSNLETSLVLARVSFYVDTSRLSVEDAIIVLQKRTKYTFMRIDVERGQVLEVLVDNWTSFSNQPLPCGDPRIPPIIHPQPEKTVVRIHYDASQVGARDALERLQVGLTRQLAPLRESPDIAAGAKQSRQAGFLFLFSAALTIPVLVFAWAPITEPRLIFESISLAFATIIQAVVAKEFFPGASTTLYHSGLVGMDFLITLTTSTVYISSVVSFAYLAKGKALSTGTFFETSTLLATLILLGRCVSAIARQMVAKSVSFRSLQEQKALLITSGRESTREVDVRLLQYGDIFKVLPHSRIVTDGDVKYGGSEVDESMITGEPTPVAKSIGNKVIAGSLNGSGELIVTLTALPFENSISRIAALVDHVQLSKPKTEALADSVASWFVPIIIVISLIDFIAWILVGIFIRHQGKGEATVLALTYAIATLIVSCPCAISLAFPMVVLIAGSVAARHGIVFRDAEKIKIARNATHVIFDKTGTLTKGDLRVVHADYYEGEPDETNGLILGLLSDIVHPASVAVASYVGNIKAANVENIKSIPGSGVEGVLQASGDIIRAGNPDWLGLNGLESIKNHLDSHHTIVCVMIESSLRAIFRLQDHVREDSAKTIAHLTSRGITVCMLSGDTDGAVQDIAFALNIPKAFTKSRCSPTDKQKYINEIQNLGGVVIFCGDCVNDAVALKQADIGVHIMTSSDMTSDASDVVLTAPNLSGIPIMMDISRAAFRRIMFNFVWAAIYNVVAVLMAAGIFIHVRIPPALAGLGEIVSVIPVVLIAFWLKYESFGGEFRRERSVV
ncbi:heavy metal translocatin [Lepidopterella palustris CBS 459.81]|uniref:Heavy metal translocatin n=1 Tax=Lepidopterella palustris CBS 459.81 TaxID=1314670 RepID=A0A8E2E202_9PEZI|nr:heavy metal translocatin [Lepidopterella palustris CBS 459.81]